MLLLMAAFQMRISISDPGVMIPDTYADKIKKGMPKQ